MLGATKGPSNATILRILALVLAYLAAARLGLAIDAAAGFAALVWAPSGIALSALLLGGNTLWPGVFLGAFLANLAQGAPIPVCMGIAAGNTLEALVGSVLLRRAGFLPSFERLRDVVAFTIFGAALNSTVSATIGTASLSVGGLAPAGERAAVWASWWVGDTLGALVVAPLILTWAPRSRASGPDGRPFEIASLVALVILTGGFVFRELHGPVGPSTVFLPLILWASLRFSQRMMTFTVFLIATLAIANTAMGMGPFWQGSVRGGLLGLQIFMAVITVTGLVLSAVIGENRRLARKAAEALQAREDFISIASHELRTPMTTVKLLTQFLQQNLGANPALESGLPGVRDHLQRLDRQVARLDGLVGDLLDIARIRSGKLDLRPERFDLGGLVEETLESLGEQLARAGNTVAFSKAEGICLHADRGRIEQVVTNLLSNAAKYAPGTRIEVTVRTTGDQAILEVSDRGPGIPEDQQRRVFDRFERLDPGASSGLGLGLFIVKEIVEAHRGDVSLRSAPGEGATFQATLPLAPPLES